MPIVDFVVPNFDDPKEIGVKICEQLFVKRIEKKKPTVILCTGDSGEGKSYTALKILEIVNNYFGVKTEDHMENQIIYTPLEYSKKMNAILHDKDKRKLKCLILDEARELVSSHLWYTFVNQAIADVNALHRTVKPLVFVVVVQFIKDIDPSTRRTIQFYMNCQRPMNEKHVTVRMHRLWKDERDIDNPRIKKRKIRGYLYNGDNQTKPTKYMKFVPTRMQITLPEKIVYKQYEKINFERKSEILARKLDRLLHEIEKEAGVKSTRVTDVVNWFMDHPESADMIQRRVGGKTPKCKMKPEFKRMFNLNNTEAADFEKALYQRLKATELVAKQNRMKEGADDDQEE
ncbi:MAG: hypothetical protein ACOC80_12070 [Petrotogales bacterium]